MNKSKKVEDTNSPKHGASEQVGLGKPWAAGERGCDTGGSPRHHCLPHPATITNPVTATRTSEIAGQATDLGHVVAQGTKWRYGDPTEVEVRLPMMHLEQP
ncbi:hypothetical protein GUJ93_ZPchr0014g46560 [Zizania palustris]|uniref:Uncharacterized protein n=1 Tax=Zizania palustris TaxID=103762 RepID=A0A8J5W6Q6_ZIZPA|nr:hypothetical protein GUJ93_ZPchr0014g46560 [Zizania palustris]